MAKNTGRGVSRTFGIVIVAALAIVVVQCKDVCMVCDCNDHLHIVDCSRRGLVELPTGIPNDTTVLLLEENSLQEIPHDGFKGFTSLSMLNIKNNHISKPFELPPSLRILLADGNQIQDIKPMLKNSGNLHAAHFANNNISIIENDTFQGCTNLSTLGLTQNRISSIQQRGLVGLSKLFVLNLDGNDLKCIPSHALKSLVTLELIGFSRNQLDEIPPELFLDPKKHLYKSYNRVRFSTNHIRLVSPRAFDGVHSVNQLFLSANLIVSLPEDLFAKLLINTSLDLSSNRLTAIPDRLLRGQHLLQELYFQNNQISVLNGNMFKGLRALTKLLIFDNPIFEIADWQFYETSLTNLYLFQANLTSIGTRPFATRNNTIKHVSLFGNKLETISDLVWQDLGANCKIAIDGTLRKAPATCRSDLDIKLVKDGFAETIRGDQHTARALSASGFECVPSKFEVGLWLCTPCLQGFYGRTTVFVLINDFDRCVACPPGGFYQSKTGQYDTGEGRDLNCQTCNNGTYVTPATHPGISPADCIVCPSGTNKNPRAGFRACPCLDNYYRTDRFGECYPCPAGGLNCSGEYQHLLRGFWWIWDWGSSENYFLSYKRFVQNVRTENTSYDPSTKNFSGVLPKVHRCLRDDSCVNTGDGINATCGEGYTGWLCSQCIPGHYSWFDHCYSCPQWWVFCLEVLAAFAVLCVIVIVIGCQLHRSRSTGRSVINVLLARGKILLGFYQVMGEIFSALNEISWPTILTSVGTFFKLLEVNIMQLIISPRCYFPEFTYPNVYIEFLFGHVFVLVVVFSSWCYYSLRKLYMIVKERPIAERAHTLSRTKQKCYLIVVMLLFVAYPSMCSVILTLLPTGCDMFNLDENEKWKVYRLRSDYSVDCHQEQHIHFSYAAEASLLYVVGFPLVLFLALWRQKRANSRSINDGTLDDEEGTGPSLDIGGEGCSHERYLPLPSDDDDELIPNTREPSHDKISWEKFLCENYKPQFWYWEIVELVRKIIQTLFVLLFGTDDHFTMFVTILISVAFMVIHAYVRPMKYVAEHRLQMCSLGIIFLNVLAASLLLMPTEDGPSGRDRKEILAVILVVMNLSIIVFVAGSLLWRCVRALLRHGCGICHLVSCIGTLCCKFCGRRTGDEALSFPS